MSRELLIFRHGKARDAHETGKDAHRELRDKGKRQAQRIGVWLLEHDLIPVVVVASSAERAMVTAQKALKAGGQQAHKIVKDKRVYNASLETLLTVLSDYAEGPHRVMLVGHNPGLEELVRYLAGPSLRLTSVDSVMNTGCLVRMAMPPIWRDLMPGTGRVLNRVDPGDLPERFPYPAPGHKADEFRDRPAYYYTQSAVIPYRLVNGALEIMVITSSKKNHWVVPKGIHEPGLSAQDSAANEAEEEAGVRGVVSKSPVGEYQYEKWGATCTCTVFAMEVTEILHEDDWDESHRDRQWVTPADAVAHLKNEALRAIVAAYASNFATGQV